MDWIFGDIVCKVVCVDVLNFKVVNSILGNQQQHYYGVLVLLLKQHQIPSSSSFLKFDEKFRKWLKLKKLEFNSRLSFMEDESTVLYTEIPFEICISQVKKIYLFKNRVEFRIYWCKSPFGLIVYFWVCIDAENSGFIMIWLPFVSAFPVRILNQPNNC